MNIKLRVNLIPKVNSSHVLGRKGDGEASLARHPETILRMTDLGLTYYQQSRMNEAEEIIAKALALRRETLGNRNPDTIDSMASLAITYYQQGRLREAEEIQVAALAMQKEVVGGRDHNTVRIMAHLAMIYRQKGQLVKEEELEVQMGKTSLRDLAWGGNSEQVSQRSATAR